MLLLAFVAVAVVFFFVGAVYGIRDCKKHFGIPKGDVNGNFSPRDLDSAE